MQATRGTPTASCQVWLECTLPAPVVAFRWPTDRPLLQQATNGPAAEQSVTQQPPATTEQAAAKNKGPNAAMRGGRGPTLRLYPTRWRSVGASLAHGSGFGWPCGPFIHVGCGRRPLILAGYLARASKEEEEGVARPLLPYIRDRSTTDDQSDDWPNSIDLKPNRAQRRGGGAAKTCRLSSPSARWSARPLLLLPPPLPLPRQAARRPWARCHTTPWPRYVHVFAHVDVCVQM